MRYSVRRPLLGNGTPSTPHSGLVAAGLPRPSSSGAGGRTSRQRGEGADLRHLRPAAGRAWIRHSRLRRRSPGRVLRSAPRAAAVSYLTTREEVDPDRVGLLCICASAGYSLAATSRDHRVKAVATVSAAESARQFRFGADGSPYPAVFQALPDTAEEAWALGDEHGIEGKECYCGARGCHERSAKHLTWDSVDKMASSDVIRAVPRIPGAG